MHTWPRSLPAALSPTRASRTRTAYARRSTATPMATNWDSAARRSTPVRRGHSPHGAAATVRAHARPFLLRQPRDDPGHVQTATDLTHVPGGWVASQSGAGWWR